MNTLSGIKSKIWNFHLYLYFHSVNETLTINFVYFTSETLLLGTSQFINIYVSYPPERFMQWKTVTKFFKLLFMAAEWRQHFRVQGHRLSHIAWPHGVYQPIFFFFWQRDQNKHSWKPYHEPKQRWQNPFRINNQSDDRNCYNALLV